MVEELRKKYNPDNTFKDANSERIKRDAALVEVKEEKWYQKLLLFFRKIFNK